MTEDRAWRWPGAPLHWTDRYAAAGVVIATRGGHPVEFIGTVTTLNGAPLPAFADKAKRMPISLAAQEESDPKGLLDELGEFIQALRQDATSDTAETQVLGCGVSVGGHVYGDKGVIRKSFNTGWHDDFYLERDLAGWLNRNGQPLDVVVENDVTSFALHKNLTSRPAPATCSWQSTGTVLAAGLSPEAGRGAGMTAWLVRSGTCMPVAGTAAISHRWLAALNPACRCGRWAALRHGPPLTPFSAGRTLNAPLSWPLASRPSKICSQSWPPSSRPIRRLPRSSREAGTALGRGLAAVVLWLNPAKIFLYLPPALATDNKFLAGKSYLDAVHAELRDVFSIGDITPLDLSPMTELELEELAAKAAASNVLKKLLNTLQDLK